MAKALTENQCNWLHQRWPPPQCCICNHKGEIAVLAAKNERLEAENGRLKNAIVHMKRTSIGPDRSVPEDTEIWFMFVDERKAVLGEED